ncbi:MAG: hypothetical protein IID44_15290 [Planctomycetes bacterium]|nr:hypothetical protein [Planctomycetota bacterium]
MNRRIVASCLALLTLGIGIAVVSAWQFWDEEQQPQPEPTSIRYEGSRVKWAAEHSTDHTLALLFGGASDEARQRMQNLSISNTRPVDYAGPESCRKCHEENYELWSSHPHRWMNALADEETVKGDFPYGPSSQIVYRGGTASFYRENGAYIMRLSRQGITRVFKINRTIGSRFQQYYVGKMLAGPEKEDHALRTTDHVLPFGYELTRRQWVPLVHVDGHQGPDSERDDPFEIPSRTAYDFKCAICHVTYPVGNQILSKAIRFAAYAPRDSFFVASDYLDEVYPKLAKIGVKGGMSKKRFTKLRQQFVNLLASDNAIHLGIGCETCHYGAKAHVQDENLLPTFFPSGEHVYAQGDSLEEIWGKTDENKNFICSRCHSGDRPRYAAGISTWNSTDFTDAMRGHCYNAERAKSQGKKFLTCVTCHNPHQKIGDRWTPTQAEDNAKCVACHDQFRSAAGLTAHTHHSAGGEGSHCMNCHMPRINEGLRDMARTHTIFSPTDVKMLEANQPNACNMCHVKESINWTLKHLTAWYGLKRRGADDGGPNAYGDAAIDNNYPSRSAPVTLGWLQSEHNGTRLVAADVLIKARAKWALPQVLRVLDDPYYQNRQFTVQRLEDYMKIYPGKYGYQPYMTSEERQAPLKEMSRAVTAVSDGSENQKQ